MFDITVISYVSSAVPPASCTVIVAVPAAFGVIVNVALSLLISLTVAVATLVLLDVAVNDATPYVVTVVVKLSPPAYPAPLVSSNVTVATFPNFHLFVLLSQYPVTLDGKNTTGLIPSSVSE